MAKYRLTFEVDTDLDEYGEVRGSNYENQPAIPAAEVEEFAGTFGASPGSQWDPEYLPFVKTLSVEPVEVDGDAGALIEAKPCGFCGAPQPLTFTHCQCGAYLRTDAEAKANR